MDGDLSARVGHGIPHHRLGARARLVDRRRDRAERRGDDGGTWSDVVGPPLRNVDVELLIPRRGLVVAALRDLLHQRVIGRLRFSLCGSFHGTFTGALTAVRVHRLTPERVVGLLILRLAALTATVALAALVAVMVPAFAVRLATAIAVLGAGAPDHRAADGRALLHGVRELVRQQSRAVGRRRAVLTVPEEHVGAEGERTRRERPADVGGVGSGVDPDARQIATEGRFPPITHVCAERYTLRPADA